MASAKMVVALSVVSFILMLACGRCLAQSVPAQGPASQSASEAAMPVFSVAFDESLSGWQHGGKADFAADKDERHGGPFSARVSVPSESEPNEVMLWRVLPGVAHGDWLKLSAWVRTKDVTDGSGACPQVEFLDANGQRLGFAHPAYSRDRGKAAWQYAEIEWVVPKGTAETRILLSMRSHGKAWFDEVSVVRTYRHADMAGPGQGPREVVVHTGEVVTSKFGGVGFHVFDHSFEATPQQLDEVIEKRWAELNPSFARLNHNFSWTRANWDTVAERLRRMQRTGTELYMATWDPKDANTPEALADYARKIVDSLEYFVREKGLTNIHYYCMTNELSLTSWGSLHADLPRYKAYHQALFNELKARKLDIGLLATDASPMVWWDSIEWATKNMDDITAVYGGHHYMEEHSVDDEQFYPWFLWKAGWVTSLARSRGKNFILGEFGAHPVGGVPVNGKRLDTCLDWDTPREPLVAIQLAETAMAAINAGVYGMGYWTFADFPDEYTPLGGVPSGKTYANKWGVFKFSDGNYSARAPYYGYGLLAKFFRGPSTVYKVSGNDPLLRVAAVQHHDAKTWSIAVVNRNSGSVNMDLAIEGASPSASFRKYVYEAKNVPQNPFGDLPGPAGNVAMKDGKLSDSVGGMTLTVYTTAYDDDAPAPVAGLKVEKAADGKNALTWQANAEKDLCYYRVYRSENTDFAPSLENQIGSTIAIHFTDAKAAAGKEYHYKIVAVDQSGNASK